jgi:hypothetical protein
LNTNIAPPKTEILLLGPQTQNASFLKNYSDNFDYILASKKNNFHKWSWMASTIAEIMIWTLGTQQEM